MLTRSRGQAIDSAVPDLPRRSRPRNAWRIRFAPWIARGDEPSTGEELAGHVLGPAGEAMSIAQLSEADEGRFQPILSRANVVKIGAQSMIDRGRSAVFAVIEELDANAPKHQLIIGMGAGTRARHAYHLGSKVGLPTGFLATPGNRGV